MVERQTSRLILVVDDDPEFLQQALASFGSANRVLFARDAKHAMDLMGVIGAEVTVALVDLNLPTESGFDLIQKMRKARPNLPIVAMSGVESPAVLESAKEVGADETIPKPITADWGSTLERFRAYGRPSA